METINNKVLNDKDLFPDARVLESVLGDSYPQYLALLDLFDENDMTHEWRYYLDGKTWLCKVRKKKKTIVWMSAWPGYMQATVYVPEARIPEIGALDLSERAKARIAETKRVGKSLPCIFEIRDAQAIRDLNTVMQRKMEWK